jgi:uracil-DNA glycosylase
MKDKSQLFPFFNTLAYAPSSVFNPWSQECFDDYGRNGVEIRRANLVEHLDIENPQLILVGEAPGFRGCRVTGVPFTAERQILKGMIPRVSDAFVASFGHVRISAQEVAWTEPSAAVVWTTLREMRMENEAILWNACPWHPFEEGNHWSNRAPTRTELAAGEPALKALLNMFPGVPIIAVGSVAAAQIERIGGQHRLRARVRHPAFGGALIFRQGVMDAMGFVRPPNQQTELI